jgi:hypothetical protein
MLDRIKKAAKALFSMEFLRWYVERVTTGGLILAFVHFLTIPIGLFAYISQQVFTQERVENFLDNSVTFTVTEASFKGFYWLMYFWLSATLVAVVMAVGYKLMMRAYRDTVYARLFAKGLFTFFVLSGSVERFVARSFVPIDIKYAPAFKGTGYFDLGALVRASTWDYGRYSVASFYAWFPLVATSALFVFYVLGRMRREIKVATKSDL